MNLKLNIWKQGIFSVFVEIAKRRSGFYGPSFDAEIKNRQTYEDKKLIVSRIYRAKIYKAENSKGKRGSLIGFIDAHQTLSIKSR